MKTARSLLIILLVGVLCSSVALARDDRTRQKAVSRGNTRDIPRPASRPSSRPEVGRFGGGTFLNTPTGSFGGNTFLNTEPLDVVEPRYSPHLPTYPYNPHLGDFRPHGGGLVSRAPDRRSRSRRHRNHQDRGRRRSRRHNEFVPVVIVPSHHRHRSVFPNTIHAEFDNVSFTLSW